MKNNEKQDDSTTAIIFYGLLCKDDFLEKHGLSKRSHIFTRLMKIEPGIYDGYHNEIEFLYMVSNDFFEQPYLVSFEDLKRFIKKSPFEEFDSNRNRPFLINGRNEFDLNDFEPVKILVSQIKSKGAKPVRALQINSSHPYYDLNSNNIVSYSDKLPEDASTDFIFPERRLFVLKEKEMLLKYPFYTGTIKKLNEWNWVNKNEFPQGSMESIKLYFTIEPLFHKKEVLHKKNKRRRS